ncbi:MAG: hypothetical protein Fur0040_11120 [Sideroxydans sp.]
MSSCAAPPLDAPVVSLILVATGEPLLRMEKRLSCAAAGAKLRLELAIAKDAAALGLFPAQAPAVLHDGKVVFSGLPRTEAIEAWLRNLQNT